jgi:hypothetical protein
MSVAMSRNSTIGWCVTAHSERLKRFMCCS